jgi:hypothetical protein
MPRPPDRGAPHERAGCGAPAVRVTLSGDHAGGLAGDYIVEEQRADGRVILRPDLSTRAMLERHGERELTAEECEQHLGGLPTDGEG